MAKEEKEPKDKSIAGLAIGRIVHYHKVVQTATGEKMKTFAALVLDLADPVSNFRPQDGACDLKIFTSNRGGTDEVRQGVMYSEKPTANRWSWPKHE